MTGQLRHMALLEVGNALAALSGVILAAEILSNDAVAYYLPDNVVTVAIVVVPLLALAVTAFVLRRKHARWLLLTMPAIFLLACGGCYYVLKKTAEDFKNKGELEAIGIVSKAIPGWSTRGLVVTGYSLLPNGAVQITGSTLESRTEVMAWYKRKLPRDWIVVKLGGGKVAFASKLMGRKQSSIYVYGVSGNHDIFVYTNAPLTCPWNSNVRYVDGTVVPSWRAKEYLIYSYLRPGNATVGRVARYPRSGARQKTSAMR